MLVLLQSSFDALGQQIISPFLSLSFEMNVWVHVFQSCILFLSFLQTYIFPFQASPGALLKRNVFRVLVCASYPLDCAGKQCEWDRSMQRTGSICTVKDSPGSHWWHVHAVFMRREGVTEESWLQQGQQMFRSLKEVGVDWETGSGGPVRMTNLIPWMRAHILLNRLPSGGVIGRCVDWLCNGLIQEQILCSP